MSSTEKLTNFHSVKDRFAYLLKLARWKPAQAARKIPCSAGYVSLILDGKRENLGVEFLTSISKHGVRPDWLKDGVGDPPKVFPVNLEVNQSTQSDAYREEVPVLEAMTDDDLARQEDSFTSQLQFLKDGDPVKKKVVAKSLVAVIEERARRKSSSPTTGGGVSPEVATALGSAGAAQKLAQELPLTQAEHGTTGRKQRPDGGAPKGKKK